jgi:pimeloyl-ACP methyl ester carboxylesterase
MSFSTVGFERLELEIAGVRTVVYVAGRGPDVVYLHGGGTFHGFEFARDWLDRHRVFLPYHPGFGESADDPAIESMLDYVLHYRALFEELGLEKIDLVGASFGGRLAAEFALTGADRLRHLALVAPAGLASAQHPSPDFGSIAPADLPGYLVHDLRVIEPFWPRGPSAEFGAARAREGQAVGRIMRRGSLESPQLRRWLPRMHVPTLLIWGRHDRIIPPGVAGEWQQLLPDARLEIIDDAGHLLLDESPRARASVAAFLAA